MLAVVDAHHHLWDLREVHYPWIERRGERRFFGDPTPIQRDYLVDEFRADAGHAVLIGSVHVQVGVADDQSFAETAWLSRTAAATGLPSAIVAFADLTRDDLDAALDRHAAAPQFRGVRQIVGRHPIEDAKHGTDALIDDPKWHRGLARLAGRRLSFDLQLIPAQHRRMARVLAQVPELTVAICHAGSPWDQTAAGREDWRAGLAQLAALPNTCLKLSGFGMFDPQWTASSIRPLFDAALELFGPARLMLGSNLPVDKLYRNGPSIWREYALLIGELTADEQRSLCASTAQRCYRL